MIKDKITIANINGQSFDKMQIALAIRNSTYEDKLACSLLENGVIKSCDGCSLRRICKGIEELSKDYYHSTTEVLENFNF